MAVPFHSTMLDGANITINGVNIPSWGGQTGSGDGSGGGDDNESLLLQALGGRMNQYDTDIATVSAGRVIPRSDGGTTLNILNVKEGQVLTGETADGDPVEIHVERMISRNGWQAADHYMLETQPNGDLIIEKGRLHIELFIGGPGAATTYDAAKIADELGGGVTASQVTGAWLNANAPQYGAAADKPITYALAVARVNTLSGTQKTPATPWIHLQRGYDYSGLGPMQWSGESPLHPIRFGAWGTGADPTGFSHANATKFWRQANHVITGFFAKIVAKNGINMMLDGATYNGTGGGYGISINGEDGGAGYTFYRCFIHNCTAPAPTGANGTWDDSNNRCSGVYLDDIYGALFLDTILWHNGWGEGYGQDREGHLGQPPSALNHNWYLQRTNIGTTIRNCMSLEAASTSYQMRSGGWIQNFISIEECIHGNGWAAPYTSADDGVSSLAFRQVAVGAGYKKYNRQAQGAINRGLGNNGSLWAQIDSVVLHHADPDNPAELADKVAKFSNRGFDYISNLLTNNAFFNGVSYNFASTDRNVDGLDLAVLGQTTIQRHAGSKIDGSGRRSVREYAQWLLDQPVQQRGALITDAVEYFLTPIAPKLLCPPADPYRPRATAVHQVFDVFTPGEGFRWDMAPNWSQKMVPGKNAGDSADLNRNEVKFLIDTSTISGLTFGAGGRLDVSSGLLRVNEADDPCNVVAMNCGQYYAPQSGHGNYTLRGGGRVVMNPTGTTQAHIHASGQSELCLGRNDVIPEGMALRVVGDGGWVGWDLLDGAATLEVAGALEFEVTPILNFSSSHLKGMAYFMHAPINGQLSGFTGDLDWFRPLNGDNYHYRVRNANGTPIMGENLVNEDTHGRAPKKWAVAKEFLPGEIGKIQRFRSGRFNLISPAVSGTVSLSGSVDIIGRQYLAPGIYDLGGGAGTGVTYINNGASLAAGLTLTGGKLELTI